MMFMTMIITRRWCSWRW